MMIQRKEMTSIAMEKTHLSQKKTEEKCFEQKAVAAHHRARTGARAGAGAAGTRPERAGRRVPMAGNRRTARPRVGPVLGSGFLLPSGKPNCFF